MQHRGEIGLAARGDRLRGERQLSALSVARDRRGQPSGLPSVPRAAARPASRRRPASAFGTRPGIVSNCADDAWHAFRSLKSTFPPCGVRVPGWPAHLRRGRSLPTCSTASWRGARRVIPKAIPGLGRSAHLLRHLTPGAPAGERQALPGPGSSAITLPGQWCCPGDQARSRLGHRSWPQPVQAYIWHSARYRDRCTSSAHDHPNPTRGPHPSTRSK